MNDESARTVLEAHGVGKTFPAGRALRSFDVSVRAGHVHALVGENGSGKSTFIKILSGYHVPDPGSRIRVDGKPLDFGDAQAAYRLGCRFVHQDLGLIEDLSVADNLSLSIGFPTRLGTVRPRALRSGVRDALRRAGLDVDPGMPVSELGPATRTGVAVARALRDDGAYRTRLIVMDEPTATLPEDEVRHLLGVLRSVARNGVAVLYVSHRLEEVFSLCDEVTVLRDGVKVGTWPVRELTRPQLVTRMVGQRFLDAERVIAEEQDEAAEPKAGTDVCLRVEDISTDELRGVSLLARRGSITGIAGITGSGRETILATIFGGRSRSVGRVAVNDKPVRPASPRHAIRAGMSYLPPDRKNLGAMLDMTASENLTVVDLKPLRRLWTMRKRAERATVRSWFAELEVRPPGEYTKVFATFSGGNQQKILFAKWMRPSPELLLLDEPTQGVDVGAKALLHQQTIKYAARGGTVVVSSSDVEELLTLCDRVLVMRAGRIVAELSGDSLTATELTRHSLDADDRSTRS